MSYDELGPYFDELRAAFPFEYYNTSLESEDQRWGTAFIQRFSDSKWLQLQVDFDSADPIGEVIVEAQKSFPEHERGAPLPPGGIIL